jgi:hypothetical protein
METNLHREKEVFGPFAQPKQFVLCFDGTGNKFAGDESDTNLVKIYRVGTFPSSSMQPYSPAQINRCWTAAKATNTTTTNPA